MQLICLNQNKEHKKESKVKRRMKIILLLMKTVIFTKLGPIKGNNFSTLSNMELCKEKL